MESSTTPSTSDDEEQPFYDVNLHHGLEGTGQPPAEGDGDESFEEEQEEE